MMQRIKFYKSFLSAEHGPIPENGERDCSAALSDWVIRMRYGEVVKPKAKTKSKQTKVI